MYDSIHLKEHLDPPWQEWVEGLASLYQASDITPFTGTLPDQVALLHGLLRTLRRLELTLLNLSMTEQPRVKRIFLREHMQPELSSTRRKAIIL